MKDLLKGIVDWEKGNLKFTIPMIIIAVSLMILGVEFWMPLFVIGFVLFLFLALLFWTP